MSRKGSLINKFIRKLEYGTLFYNLPILNRLRHVPMQNSALYILSFLLCATFHPSIFLSAVGPDSELLLLWYSSRYERLFSINSLMVSFHFLELLSVEFFFGIMNTLVFPKSSMCYGNGIFIVCEKQKSLCVCWINYSCL